jgi:hypothetical protein
MQKLCFSQPKTPIFRPVLNTRDDQISLRKTTHSRQLLSEACKHVLFVLGSPALLKDLNDDQVVRPCKPEIRVLAYNLACLVLRDNLAA